MSKGKIPKKLRISIPVVGSATVDENDFLVLIDRINDPVPVAEPHGIKAFQVADKLFTGKGIRGDDIFKDFSELCFQPRW